jgi:hypothetical protein
LCQAAENNCLFSAANPWPPKITAAAENGVQCCCGRGQRKKQRRKEGSPVAVLNIIFGGCVRGSPKIMLFFGGCV